MASSQIQDAGGSRWTSGPCQFSWIVHMGLSYGFLWFPKSFLKQKHAHAGIWGIWCGYSMLFLPHALLFISQNHVDRMMAGDNVLLAALRAFDGYLDVHPIIGQHIACQSKVSALHALHGDDPNKICEKLDGWPYSAIKNLRNPYLPKECLFLLVRCRNAFY